MVDDCVLASGVIIAFESWPPDEPLKSRLLAELAKDGLRVTDVMPRFSVWVASFNAGSREVRRFENTCRKLDSHPDFAPMIDYCEPDVLLHSLRCLEPSDGGIEPPAPQP